MPVPYATVAPRNITNVTLSSFLFPKLSAMLRVYQTFLEKPQGKTLIFQLKPVPQATLAPSIVTFCIANVMKIVSLLRNTCPQTRMNPRLLYVTLFFKIECRKTEIPCDPQQVQIVAQFPNGVLNFYNIITLYTFFTFFLFRIMHLRALRFAFFSITLAHFS